MRRKKEFYMKNKVFGKFKLTRNAKVSLLIIALIAVIGFLMASCEGNADGGNNDNDDNNDGTVPQSVTFISKDSDGNLYKLEITENTARYAAKQGDAFKLTVELYNDGIYSLALSYEGRIGSATAKSGTEIEISITVNNKPLNITISGTAMTVISGTIKLDNGAEKEFTGAEPLTPIETPEDLPDIKRWSSWTSPSAIATISYSVDKDGVCAITIGGKPQPNNETDSWGKWKAQALYGYTAQTNARYAYEFEAWTQLGGRTVNVQYYGNNDDGEYLNYEIPITATRTTYTIFGDAIPKTGDGANINLIFQCADQLGTFYVKILSIKKYEESDRWWSYVSQTATATLTYSVANDGVCTITVGGTAETGLWDKWKAQAGYAYNANANYSYEYVFEAWTQSGSRTVNVQYYGNNDDGEYLSREITLTGTRTAYSIFGDAIPKTGGNASINLIFQCADQTGTFYVKILSIKELIWGSSGDYDYVEGSSTTAITGYNGSGGALTIPGTLNGKSVTAILDRAFLEKELTSVTIPNSVTSIGVDAFEGNQLTSVTIGNSVISIGTGAFSENRLTSVTFAANSKLATIGGNAFFMNQITSVTIPNSVTSIEWGAFNENLLTNVTIGSGVTDIGDWAFHHNRLASITIPNSVKSIWHNAFSNNPLTSVTIGASVTLHQNDNEDEYKYVFPGDLDSVYTNGGKASGTYTGTLAQNDENYDNTSWSKN